MTSSAPASGPDYRRVTAAMVAERANVSTATVSLVANGKTAGRVSADIIDRVSAAINELGYIVDNAASSLATGAGSFVVLVAPDISNPFYSEVMTGVRRALGSDWQLLLSVTENGLFPAVQDVRRLIALRPAGILVHAPSKQFLAELAVQTPMVVLDAPGAEHAAAAVDLDVESGGAALADHLADLGHHRVAYLDSVTGTVTFTLRRKAFEDRARQCGLTLVDAFEPSTIDLGAAAQSFTSAVGEIERQSVTAVVCATDTQAFGVLQAAKQQGLRVPEDLAVTGFDDLPYSAASSPGLTTVRLPALDLGTTAGTQLRALIQGKPLEQTRLKLPSELVIRGSTAG